MSQAFRRKIEPAVDWQSLGRGFGLLAALLCLSVALVAAERSDYSRSALLQPFVGPELAQWLVGPIARMASESEIEAYLELRSDDEARVFIEEFWRQRDPTPEEEEVNEARLLFEQRATEADKKYTESAVSGRRTDRGTIYILYGPPESVEFEQYRDVDGPDVELWRYAKGAEKGLDGRRPERIYRFARQGDLTSFYSPRDFRSPRRRRSPDRPPLFPRPAEPPGPPSRS